MDTGGFYYRAVLCAVNAFLCLTASDRTFAMICAFVAGMLLVTVADDLDGRR